jgi:uncharacterized protein (UPF0333 family)
MKNNKAQSTLEYVLLVAIIVAVFMAMLGMLTFSSMGKYKQAGDAISGGNQYEPGVTQVR